jgi:hypothetical protein
MRAAIAVLLAAVLALAARGAWADSPSLRWSRPIAATEGWSRVPLPDDVLAACRPGLPDLRVHDPKGAEVPFVLEQSLGSGVPEAYVARDVESVPGRETTAVVDRGPTPRPADAATIELDAADFLKPVVVESSDDARTWKEIARGSIFAARGPTGARMTTLRFAPNDRRYWRLRLDDRNGPPVTPRAVLTGAFVAPPAAPREIAFDVRATSSEGGESNYEVTLPTANLTLSAISLAPTDAVFVRRVTISERVLFRDEIIRRVVGSATISRGPGGESLVVPLGELRGPSLEIRIEDGASPPLSLARATATVAPRSLLLHAPAASLPVTLDYGSFLLAPARYDLSAVVARGRPDAVSVATLGPAVDRGAALPVGIPPHGARLDESLWQTEAAIDLPGAGGVVYLPLEGIDVRAGLRVIDGTSREVPFLFEQAVHHARETVRPVVTESGARTTATLSSLAAVRELDSLELTATAPDYFVRSVTVVESVRDGRGRVGERVLGSGAWERPPGSPPTPLVLSLTTPTQPTLEIRIDNGNNPALTLGDVTLTRSVRRIDFLSAPGDSLSLLTGNSAAGSPSYDLALLAGALLALPAQPAHLEPARDIAPAHAPPAKWFWVAVIVAGLGVAAALARALGTPRRA